MSFRLKLLIAMMLVVGAVTTATLLATQQRVQAAYEQIFDEQFRNQIQYFANLQEARLSGIRQTSLGLASSVRMLAGMEILLTEKDGETVEDLYRISRNELFKPGSGGSRGGPAPFFRLLDVHGDVLTHSTAPPHRGNRPPSRRDLDLQLEGLAKAMEGADQQQVGYLAPATESDDTVLHEVILTKIIDPTNGRVLGALVQGFRVDSFAEKSLNSMSQIQSGILLDGEIHSRSIPEPTRLAIVQKINAALSSSSSDAQGRFPISINNRPHTVLFRALNRASAFPPAHQICVYSLDEPVRVQRELRGKILLFGALAMLAALAVSLVLSHSLSVPIHELVAGTRQVEKGDFAVRVPVRSRDEIGQLAQSFNEMTSGLALKEKYRSVLDLVADKRIADDLIHGKIALGGELRDVSVLFCDIRGFTALTQHMEPAEVIQMLNEHFTPLTRLVYEHHGVVDKFVGDLIMAVFGAPTSHGNDPLLAAQCALRMIEERAKLSENSKYRITVGIGVATGKAIAGRMGSADRLNYTVLGPRVNLASRLCGQAGRMEVVIDDATFAACRDIATVDPLPELRLKGFTEPVQAYKLTALRHP